MDSLAPRITHAILMSMIIGQEMVLHLRRVPEHQSSSPLRQRLSRSRLAIDGEKKGAPSSWGGVAFS